MPAIMDIASKQNDLKLEKEEELKHEKEEELKREEEEESNENLIDLIKVGYRGRYIRIYFNERSMFNRYFFDPLVQLDPNSISVESSSFFQKYAVRFTIEMWNSEIRSKVFDRVRSLPLFYFFRLPEGLKEEDIYVLPFGEVQLVLKEGGIHPSVQLMADTPKPYYGQQKESLDFYLLCDSAASANAFAEDFRRNSEFVLEYMQLKLVCRGLSLTHQDKSRDEYVKEYNVST